MPSRGPSDTARWPVLVAVSAALHALVFSLFSLGPPLPPPRPRASPLLLVPFELSSTPPAPIAPRALPPPPSPRPAARFSLPSPGAASAQSSGPAAVTQGGGAVVGADAPRDAAPRLTPRMEAVFGGGSGGEPAHGFTLRNGPGEVVDQAVAREVEGERLTRRLNAELLGDVGEAAVGAGTVPAHFRRAESTMREAFEKMRVDRTPLTGKQIFQDVAQTLFATGGGVSEAAARRVADSPLGNSVKNQTVSAPNTDDNRFREQGLQLMAGVEALKERSRAARLKTVLQLTTDPSGAVADVTVLERSGDARFDESVMHLSRKVFRHLPDDDEKALGVSWWLSKWQFTWEPPDVRVRLLDAHRLPPTP